MGRDDPIRDDHGTEIHPIFGSKGLKNDWSKQLDDQYVSDGWFNHQLLGCPTELGSMASNRLINWGLLGLEPTDPNLLLTSLVLIQGDGFILGTFI